GEDDRRGEAADRGEAEQAAEDREAHRPAHPAHGRGTPELDEGADRDGHEGQAEDREPGAQHRDLGGVPDLQDRAEDERARADEGDAAEEADRRETEPAEMHGGGQAAVAALAAGRAAPAPVPGAGFER